MRVKRDAGLFSVYVDVSSPSPPPVLALKVSNNKWRRTQNIPLISRMRKQNAYVLRRGQISFGPRGLPNFL